MNKVKLTSSQLFEKLELDPDQDILLVISKDDPITGYRDARYYRTAVWKEGAHYFQSVVECDESGEPLPKVEIGVDGVKVKYEEQNNS